MKPVSFDEAFSIVMESARETGTEIINFTSSLNRVLRREIVSDMDMPPFDKSTVDGYACRRESLRDSLELLGTVAAGSAPEREVGTGQCMKVMTGAAVPPGADMVFMVEDSELLPGGCIRYTGQGSKDNISPRGEDVRKGECLLESGIIVRPQDIAIMALAGATSVEVSRLPVISVISSGDEIVEPGEEPGPYSIRNTNSYQLLAQIERAGAAGRYLGIARDDEAETFHLVSRALEQSDIVLISGGVSMGDFDLVPAVLDRAEVNILFSRVNIQPGRPTTFGVHRKALVFGLPGNPVSTFVQFELLVRPLIGRMTGAGFHPDVRQLVLKERFTRRSADRMAFVPVTVSDDNEVVPLDYHGSAHISAYSLAAGIMTIPEGKNVMEKGELVSVRQI